MFTVRVGSAEGLASMPFVFRTSSFCARAGIEPSSASRALRAAAAAGVVSRVGRGLWQRNDREPPVVECLTSHPFPPAWMNTNECLMDAVFGRGPRRISHMTALESAGVPLVALTQLSFPHESTGMNLPRCITVFRERADRVRLFAGRLTERTWMSSGTRAAIEIAQHQRAAPRWDERIAWAFADGGTMFDVDEAVEISDVLQMRAGLRRLSSIADALRRLAADDSYGWLGDVPGEWAEIVTARRGDKWIHLDRPRRRRRPYEPSDAAWVDSERKVLWHRYPEWLAAALLT